MLRSSSSLLPVCLFLSCIQIQPLAAAPPAADSRPPHAAREARLPRAPAERLAGGRFGTVAVYRRSPHPRHVALFLSGDGGWNRGVVEMASLLADLDTLVVGIDLPRYLHQLAAADEKCSYPAADLEQLSQAVQRQLGMPAYVPPVVVGYSSGATMAYGVLAQAPTGTFRGGLSLGFCPDLPLKHPLCTGHGLTSEPIPKGKGYNFLPSTHMEIPWIAFQGEVDQVCSKDFAERYAAAVPHAEVVLLPKVGHGFAVEGRWAPQFRQAFGRLVAEPERAGKAGSQTFEPQALPGLPLVEVPARGAPAPEMAVVLSGDGGWAGLDREIAGALSAKGVPVVGLSSLQYFWTARTPDGAGHDLTRILTHYLAAWQRRQALLVGYSLGADVLPFLASRLPAGLLARVSRIALIAPSGTASFEFHVGEWLGLGGDRGLPVLPEVRKLAGRPLLCLYGQAEKDSLCPRLGLSPGQAMALPGGHHFGGDYAAVARWILQGSAGSHTGR